MPMSAGLSNCGNQTRCTINEMSNRVVRSAIA